MSEEKLSPQVLAVKKYLANELDRDNCLPTDEVRAVMNKWLEMKEVA